MTKEMKASLKKFGKGALWTLVTAGGYLLAKGALHLILTLLEPKKESARSASTSSSGH
jgi:hypothetical protein